MRIFAQPLFKYKHLSDWQSKTWSKKDKIELHFSKSHISKTKIPKTVSWHDHLFKSVFYWSRMTPGCVKGQSALPLHRQSLCRWSWSIIWSAHLNELTPSSAVLLRNLLKTSRDRLEKCIISSGGGAVYKVMLQGFKSVSIATSNDIC